MFLKLISPVSLHFKKLTTRTFETMYVTRHLATGQHCCGDSLNWPVSSMHPKDAEKVCELKCCKAYSVITFNVKSRWQPTQSPIQWACMPFIPYHSGRSAKASCMACRNQRKTELEAQSLRKQMIWGLAKEGRVGTGGGSGFSPLLIHLPIRGAQQRLEADVLITTQFSEMGLTNVSILSGPRFHGRKETNKDRP